MTRLAIGWTIVHSLWEGTLAALMLACALSLIRSSRARYAAACLAMLVALGGFGITLGRMTAAGPASAMALPRPLPPPPLDAWDRAYRAAAHFSVSDILPWLATLWIAGVILFHLYSLSSWIAARRMLRRGVCKPAEVWQQCLCRLGERLRVSPPVTLLESSLADVPAVIGYLRPVILVPVGMLSGMPAGQIESILLHELAHIRRRDYLVNLLQTLVEGFLFYHPAVWWISSVIRAERENCCDDLAVSVRGNAHEYAAALAALEQTRPRCNEAVLAANGGNLMKRVRRLLYPLEVPRTVLSPVLSAVVVTITVAVALTAWQARPQDTSPAPGPTAYDRWLTQDVVYIIKDEERAAFKRLMTNEEREEFIRQFWKVRDPTPDTIENEFKEEHYRRIGYANDHFEESDHPGWKTDRGRIYIVYGPPDEIESHNSGGSYQRPANEGSGQVKTYPFEQWRYRLIQGVGNNVIMEFVDVKRTGEYHMTADPNAKVAK